MTTATPPRWPALLNTAEAADYVGVSEPVFRELRMEPDFPASIHVAGRVRRYSRVALDGWIASQQAGAENAINRLSERISRQKATA